MLGRFNCLASPISPTQIVIMGGVSLGEFAVELLFDTKNGTIATIAVPKVFDFGCYTKPALLANGSIMAIVVDSQRMVKLVRITSQKSSQQKGKQ